MSKKLNLIKMSSIEVEQIKWVWYPYIPYGKITVVQGDPGEGKTTFILALASLLTKGMPLPEEENGAEPITVIYQTAEDGLADTIKPRLLAVGADCERVIVINENEMQLTLSDERLEQAINETGAKIIVLNPNIVESLSRDIHCYCVQVNTSEYGDSRIIAPKKTEQKDIVRTKGGINYTIIVGTLKIEELRQFQLLSYELQKDDGTYKTTPPRFPTDVVKDKRRNNNFITRKKI